jgi:glycosyltransferase involved in cell wall biosynthesis
MENHFSIVILTQDEEANLPDCLKSIAWCDDIIVIDSGSHDKTLEIAQAGGCKILHRKFDNFGEQRNFVLDHADFKHAWVFHLDADERFTEALRSECEAKISDDALSGFLVPSKLMLGRQWLKHSGCYPVYQMRFHKLGEVRFVAYGHGQRETESARGIGTLREPYIHYNFSKGLVDWCKKHVSYAERESNVDTPSFRFVDLFARDAITRRRTLKAATWRCPFRPLMKFSYLYFLRGGFLDGVAGFKYSLMNGYYEFMVGLFRWEQKCKRASSDK